MFKNNRAIESQPDVVTTDLYVQKVIDTEPCVIHDAEQYQPCFECETYSRRGFIQGICNRRAKRAGFDAPINPRSLISRRIGRNDG